MFWITRGSSLFALILLGFTLAMESSSTTAQFQLTLNPYYLYDGNRELSSDGSSKHEAGIIIKPQASVELGDHWQGFFYGYGILATSTDNPDADTGNSEAYVGLRELWLDWNGLTEYPGESIRLGRERLKDDDGIWSDSDISLLRWRWNTTLWDGTVGVAEKLDDFQNDDAPLAKDERDLFRVFAGQRLQYRYHHYMEARAMYVRGSDESLYQPRLTWLSLGLDDDYFSGVDEQDIDYRAALLAVSGSEVPENRRVDVNGWATDLGLRWRPRLIPGFALGVQYAYAPADGDQGFRQTGLESNRARFTGTQASFYRFNEAFRADLYNLQSAAAYASLSQDQRWDMSLVVQQFWMDDPDVGIRAHGISVDPEGQGRNLGQGVDLVTSWYWGATAQWPFDSYLRLRGSAFMPGEAFSDEQDYVHSRVALDWVNTW